MQNTYVFMGQALQDRAPSFCICVYGSDNKFNAGNVLNRWQYLKKQASLHDIEIVGFSSDGDTRCLKAMKEASNFPVSVDTINNDCPYKPYFQVAFAETTPPTVRTPSESLSSTPQNIKHNVTPLTEQPGPSYAVTQTPADVGMGELSNTGEPESKSDLPIIPSPFKRAFL
ncbi:hypothetical protein RN001_009161 [Aquatica leii]|uniref:Uncharacterized protein n=1 Tax=Aquatica leii TaxID=1421715 RepID=A0AAN7NZ78_9COLE|nr:hypothetical protein RN001_009161 [Aquatica leii]